MPHTDIVVVGAGHNGLVAAILAAAAGRRVTVFDAARKPGGATVGEVLFDGHPARLSRYSYLVSLFPAQLAERLGIRLVLASRAVSSYTPVRRGSRETGLLVERRPGTVTEQSFLDVTGSGQDYTEWQRLYGELGAAAGAVAPGLLGPLPRRAAVRAAVTAAAGSTIWDDIVEQPLGQAITRRFRDDTVRGVVATDGLIGTHTSVFSQSLLANRCFLYHVIGRGTGEWLVPVGGMGALTDALLARARELGVDIRTESVVTAADEDADGVEVSVHADVDATWHAEVLLAAVAPGVVDGWLGRATVRPIGAQLKVNMLLDRLPTLKSGLDPATAFAGTTHLEEGFEQLEAAYRRSAAGDLPTPLPGEVYCHSLTDPSILGGRPGATLTLFGLHTPVGLFDADNAGRRAEAADAALAALQTQLAEPLLDCVSRSESGELCLDVASPLDLESDLRMPGGNIFHGDLTWPWLDDDEPAETAAERHGVAVAGSRRILLAGAGSRRGGGVSGLGGAAAVDALLAG